MDHRDVAAKVRPWAESIDKRAMTATVWIMHDDGDEELVTVRCEYAVCGTCEGRGTHVNPSIDSHGLSADDFAEDPDFAESYFNGRYDVRCYECSGDRVVLQVAEDDPHSDAVWAKIQSDWDFAREIVRERELGY